MKVCVIEEDEDTRFLLVAYFRRLGASVLGSRGGDAGCDLIVDELPRLALIDLRLEADGLEVARRVRAFVREPVYLVATTEHWTPELEREVRDAGFDEHLVKPIKRDDLRELLRRIPPS